MNRHPRFALYLLIASLACLAGGAPARADAVEVSDAELGFVRCDAAKVVGAEACVKCHAGETEVWKQTPHFATFETLHRRPEAKAIADKLGLPSVKRNEVCIKCHFNHQSVDGRVRITGGVTCESCHGAARDWLETHNDYGDKQLTRLTEPPEHRAERIRRAVEAGMNNPTNLYLVARQCLACHTTPDERLVNVGGHPAGSPDFELVAWSQGMVRHNFLRNDGKANGESSRERLRLMFVVGVMADLEASLRATAAATEKAEFAVASAKRAVLGKKRLYEISQAVDNTLVRQAAEAAVAVRLKLNNREALLAAADAVGRAAYELAASEDGTNLSAVDPLVPTSEQFRWQPAAR
jgi:hypothetical protein